MKHQLPPILRQEPIRIEVIGAGGNGAQFMNGLARLHLSLKALRHPHGIVATLHDPDIVTEANIGRQLFSPADVGQYKANVIVNRLNMFYGLNWFSCPGRWAYPNTHERPADFVVGAVDSAASRREIWEQFRKSSAHYWLDMGNDSTYGQVILGEHHKNFGVISAKEWVDGDWVGKKVKMNGHRLPTVLDLFPKLRNPKLKEDNTPSCSLAGALVSQDLFINQLVATWAVNLLWRFFRDGGLDIHGYFINARDGVTTPLPIDHDTWHRFGWHHHGIAPLRKIKKVLRKARPLRMGRAKYGKFKLECGHVQEGVGRYRIRCEQCASEGKE